MISHFCKGMSVLAVLIASNASAQVSKPCGLELGIWASTKAACSAKTPEEMDSFGETALFIDFDSYRHDGQNVFIREARLEGQKCTLMVSGYGSSNGRSFHYSGSYDIVVESPRKLKFGDRPDSPEFQKCEPTGEPSEDSR
jgi:hypothetical protein